MAIRAFQSPTPSLKLGEHLPVVWTSRALLRNRGLASSGATPARAAVQQRSNRASSAGSGRPSSHTAAVGWGSCMR